MTQVSGTRDEWRQIIASLNQKLKNSHLDFKIYNPSDGLRIDISRERTDKDLDFLKDAVSPYLEKDTDDETLLKNAGIPPTQNLYSRFFLAVGDEVYANRKYIFDQLKSDPHGDIYFQILMKSLAWFERGNKDVAKTPTPSYKGYPQTIEEAEKYF